MKIMNVIVVYDRTRQQILMCLRRKDPYKGKLNFVGGKLEAGESSEEAAYRELQEETGIRREQITLVHLMDMVYYTYDMKLEIFTGRLKEEVTVSGEENDLLWLDADENFEDMNRFAGEGNIAHIIEMIRDDIDNILK
jgi:8-oxo-dGTP diphosphatase